MLVTCQPFTGRDTARSLAEELVAAAQAQAAAQDAQAAADAARADATALARRLAAAEELLGEVRSDCIAHLFRIYHHVHALL
jgi:uncharacterized membrane protein YqiK